MPLTKGGTFTNKCTRLYLMERVEGIKTIFTLAAEKDGSRELILDTKERGMKFKEDIIIFGKLINRQKILTDIRDMENIFKKKIFSRRV